MKQKIPFPKTLLLLVILALCLAACKKLFKEDTENTFKLNTRADYDVAMTGLYNKLFYSIMGNNLIYLFSIGNEDDLNVAPHYGNQQDKNRKCEFTVNSNIFAYSNCHSTVGGYGYNIGDFSFIYKILFQTVGAVNDILSKAGNIETLQPDIKKIIGEVYFIRAYSYYRLVRLYGQVPIAYSADVSFSLEKASYREIYQLIEKDLIKAIQLLPKNNQDARIKYETPHAGSAKALLAEVYLTMGGWPLNDNTKYSAAASLAKEVIDSSANFGFGLMPDLADLWNGTHTRNQESVFSFYILDSLKDVSSGKEVFNNELYTYTNSTGLNVPYNNSISKRYSDIIVAPDFYNSFPRNYRKEVSFQTRHVPNNFSGVKWNPVKREYTIYFDSLYIKHYDSINYSTDIAYKKFYTQFDVADSFLLKSGNMNTSFYGHYRGGVVYIFRYAQTLLTYAEAKARIGEIDASAYEAVNQVRRRANKVDLFSSSPFDLQQGLSQSQFLDSVIQERAWELCAEPEGRWFDILRLNLTSKLVEIKRKQNIMVYPIPTQDNNFFLPIPLEDQLPN